MLAGQYSIRAVTLLVSILMAGCAGELPAPTPTNSSEPPMSSSPQTPSEGNGVAGTQARFEADIQTIAGYLAPYGCQLLPNWHKDHTYHGGFYVFDDSGACPEMQLSAYQPDDESLIHQPSATQNASECQPAQDSTQGEAWMVWEGRVFIEVRSSLDQDKIRPERIRDILGIGEMACLP